MRRPSPLRFSLRDRRGFSLAEVMVATLVLCLGVIGLVSASASVTRLLGDGRRGTTAAQAAERRLELLRQSAALAPACGLVTGGAASVPGGITERWTVAGSGPTRLVRVETTWPAARRLRADTVATLLRCR